MAEVSTQSFNHVAMSVPCSAIDEAGQSEIVAAILADRKARDAGQTELSERMSKLEGNATEPGPELPLLCLLPLQSRLEPELRDPRATGSGVRRAAVDGLPGAIDYLQTHHYDPWELRRDCDIPGTSRAGCHLLLGDMGGFVLGACRRKQAMYPMKPHFVGECGVGPRAVRRRERKGKRGRRGARGSLLVG